ncbi:MAG: GTPase [Gammaproteobacteria bacterium]|nr:GTPase [Gammaproteobacteria bacterium]
MSNQADHLSLKLPPHDLEVLSFSAPNPKKIKEWVEGLPQMNVGECAKRLYAAIQELNRLKTDSETRFQMMETLRGPIHFICKSLEKHFLNKSVILPEKEAKIAGLAQALQNHLATGYKAVCMQLLPRVKNLDKEAKKLCQRAIHRAMSEENQVLLRSFQLYFPAPPGFWREMHLLYLIAQRFGMLEQLCDDPEEQSWESSVYEAYERALLLATSKPNQLRQQQIEQVHAAAKHWAKFASVTDAQSTSGLFVIDVMSDAPPVYQSLMKRTALPHNLRFFDASAISDQLRVMLQLPAGQPHPVATFHMPDRFPADLARILIQAWGVLTERAFTRIDEHGQLTLCLGLSATHYFVSGRADFNKMILGGASVLDVEASNRFIQRGPTNRRDTYETNDVWGPQINRTVQVPDGGTIQYNIEQHAGEKNAEEKAKYPQYQCEVVNTSPGGFCLTWKQDVPPQVKTGEIVGIMENDKNHWSIGVIRWVKQFKNEGARMGVELIAPKADACGTQVVHKKGGVTEYMRTLMLPELRAIGQPATLITPNIAFHVGYKVNISENGAVSKAQLIKQVTSTASFSQFQFKMLVPAAQPAESAAAIPPPPAPAPARSEQDDDFDSIWSSL